VGLVAQVHPAAAQIAGGGQARVEQVLHFGLAVAVAIGCVASPGAGQELHRAHRPGICDAVGRAALHDDLVAGQRPVECRSVDRPHGGAAGVGGAAVGVHRFDTPDACQQVPADTAAGGRHCHHPFGVAVGRQGHRRNAKRARGIHHRGGLGRRGRGSRDVKIGRRLGDGHHAGPGAVGRGRLDSGQGSDRGVTNRRARLYRCADGADQNDRGDDSQPGGDAGAARSDGATGARRLERAADIGCAHVRNSTGDAAGDSPGQASRCREGGSCPYVHSTVLALSWL
jgi:hypothetical protein